MNSLYVRQILEYKPRIHLYMLVLAVAISICASGSFIMDNKWRICSLITYTVEDNDKGIVLIYMDDMDWDTRNSSHVLNQINRGLR